MKYPILHERASDPIDSMGLGYLSGALTCNVTRSSNQFPALSMSYNISSSLANELKLGRVIVAEMGGVFGKQMFRITKMTPTDTTIDVSATHISGDLSYNTISKDLTQANASAVDTFKALLDVLVDPMPMITFDSDILKLVNTSWEFKQVTKASDILLGSDSMGSQTNTMQALYGGEWIFDNYHYQLKKRGGKDTNVVVRYGHNIGSITQDTAIDDTYTAIMPFATYTPEQTDTPTDTSTAYNGVGVVQYVGAGGVDIFDTPYKAHKKTGVVKNGHYYKVLRQATDSTINGATWYMLGTNQWVDGTLFTFDKSGAYVINNVNGQGTIKIQDSSANGVISSYTGVGTISYAGKGKVAIWTSPFSDRKQTGKFLANGASYKIYKKAAEQSGHVWYNLGGNQWIDGSYLSISKTSDFIATPAHGILQTKLSDSQKTIPLYLKPAGTKLSKTLTANTKWQITAVASDSSGNDWYQVSTNEWVSSDNADFKSAGTVTPMSVDDSNSQTAISSGSVAIYSKPTYSSSPTGETISVGTQWKILAQADNNGTTWYQLGASQWVDSQFFDFSGNTDVTPYAPASGSAASDDETEADVTIMLDDIILKSDLANNDERLRVLPVDLSSYNITDKDKLLEVAQAYMKDYQIGYPEVSLEINYEQMTDEYAALTSLDLYDTAIVKFDKIGLAIRAEVNQVVYNTLAHRYDTIVLGDEPVTYTHLLAQYQNEAAETAKKAADKVNDNATGLFDRMQNIVNLQGSEQTAALVKLGQDMGLKQTNLQSNLDALLNQVTTINKTVTDVSSWINSSGTATIQAYPNWSNPQSLRAVNSDGSAMVFNANGLGYYSSGGLVRSAIDSQGRIVAESITGGTITGVTMNAVEIAGSSFLQLKNGSDSTEISPQYGISTSQGLSVSGKSNFFGPTQFRAGVDFSSQNLSNVKVIYFSNGSFLNSTNGGQLWFYNSGTGQSVRLDK